MSLSGPAGTARGGTISKRGFSGDVSFISGYLVVFG